MNSGNGQSTLPPDTPTMGADTIGNELTSTLASGEKGTIRSLIDSAMQNNPYFAAGGGLMLLGTGLALAKSGMVKASRLAYKQMIVDL